MISTDSVFRETIRKALCACLSLSPSSADASALFREAYEEPEPSPRPPRNTDVIYYSLLPEEAEAIPAYFAENPSVSSHRPAVSSFLPLRLLLVCYGPHCEEYAHKIRSFLFLDGSGFPRFLLRKAGIYPVPDPPQPELLFEPEGSLWRRRADLLIRLRVKDTLLYPNTRPAISQAPAVVVHSN